MIKYIDNKKENGIKYDYQKIRKEYAKLGVPSEFFNPCHTPLAKAAWQVLLSQRSTGKTTNVLLLALVMYKLYGTQAHYCRYCDYEIAPKLCRTMYDVIIDNGYIAKLFDDKYNAIKYRARKWFLCKIDENGDEVAVDENYCTFMFAVQSASDLKSSHNAPAGDLIIYDEFIQQDVRARCDFVEFCDAVKTIFRDRLSGKIFLLANTIDKENQYFHELEIYERLSEMQIGDKITHTTERNTQIYVEIVGVAPVLKSRKKLFNKMFLGFKNSRLSGITGETTWSIKNYPHVPEDKYEIIFNKFYIEHNNKLVRLDFVLNDDKGLCCYVHFATKTYDDSIICVTKSPARGQEYYGIADTTKIGQLFKQLCTAHKVYFAANDVGSFVQNYLNQCKINIQFL